MRKGLLKGLVLALAGTVCADAMAIAPGFYMGLMMGPASNTGNETQMQYRNYQVSPVDGLPNAANPQAYSSLANPKSSQFGSRFYLGYKANEYAGFELGFTYFSGIQYVFANQVIVSPDGTTQPRVPAASTTGRVRGIDFVGKLDYSYSNTVGIFGKAGVTALYTTTPGALNITDFKDLTNYKVINPETGTPNFDYVTSGSNTYAVKLAPTFAIGATYDLDQSWQVEASYTKFMAGGSLNGMNLYALGLSYHVVDVFCGQFLCGD